MKVFLAVAEEGGFTAAAKRLSMTTPHVTRHIAALEAQLGTRLLQRTTRRVHLTEAGERYVEHVRTILDAIDAANADVQSHTNALSGMLRIVVAPSLFNVLLSPLVTAFRQKYADIHLDIHLDADPQPDLSRYDLGFLQVPEGFDANIVARTISTSETVLCASPAYLTRYGTPTTPMQLQQHFCMLRRPVELRSNAICLWPDGTSVLQPPTHEVPIQPSIIISQTASLLHMALHGVGIASFTHDLVQPFLQKGLLQPILPGWITGRYSTLAALPSRKHLPERTRAFLDFLMEHQQCLRLLHAQTFWQWRDTPFQTR